MKYLSQDLRIRLGKKHYFGLGANLRGKVILLEINLCIGWTFSFIESEIQVPKASVQKVAKQMKALAYLLRFCQRQGLLVESSVARKEIY
jgi:hypothetical protein